MKRFSATVLLILGLYLGIHKGYVALYDSEITTPVHIFPYRAVIYPKIDQKQLTEGITIHSQAHLKSLLEDFLS